MLAIAILASSGCHRVFGLEDLAADPDAAIAARRWLRVTGGGTHGCAIAEDTSLWCWGRNDVGQLGVPEVERESPIPVRVASPATGWMAIDAGRDHTCGILENRTLWCWGNSTNGVVGTGASEIVTSPRTIPGTWRAISTSVDHTCGIDEAGQLSCWGEDFDGQLGRGTTSTAVALAPTLASAATGTWRSVAVGERTTCAIRDDDGSAWCWGHNGSGQTGRGTFTPNEPAPALVANEAGPWKQLSVGDDFACGVLESGGARCWGFNGSGQLGNDDLVRAGAPVTVTGGVTDWVEIALGSEHACARRATGELSCWGDHRYAQLGTMLPANLAFFAQPRVVASAIASVATGAWTTCAIEENRTLWCAGRGGAGQRGDGNGAVTRPRKVLERIAGRELSLGDNVTCTVEAAMLRCWGENDHGQIGNGSRLDVQTPTLVAPPPGRLYFKVSAGDTSCALTDERRAFCWGRNDLGSTGSGDAAERLVPTAMSNTNVTDEIDAGLHSCFRQGPAIACWGYNEFGQTGQNLRVPPAYDDPAQINGSWATIAVGSFATCAITTTGSVQCFGSGSLGALGNGMFTDSQEPVAVSLPTPSSFTRLALGFHFGCALGPTSGLACWGNNSNGQLGDQSTITRPTPVSIPPPTANASWIALAVGRVHTCAIQRLGTAQTLWCWGDNTGGQLGIGTFQEERFPMQVGTDDDWAEVHAGEAHTCAAKLDGTVWCWGANRSGQLGTGDAWSYEHAYVR